MKEKQRIDVLALIRLIPDELASGKILSADSCQ